MQSAEPALPEDVYDVSYSSHLVVVPSSLQQTYRVATRKRRALATNFSTRQGRREDSKRASKVGSRKTSEEKEGDKKREKEKIWIPRPHPVTRFFDTTP